MDPYGIFYNPTKILSYGKVLNFSQGSRSIGKSTGFAIMLLLDYIKNKHMFIYVRRTEDETQLTAPTYFDNALDILRSKGQEIGEFSYNGGRYYLDGEICGYAIPLSLQQKYKSSNYSQVFWIIYDEFMKMPGGSSYLGGRTNSMAEVEAMTSLYQTVDRGIGRAYRNETRIVFIGNAGTFFNPFYVNYGVDKYLRPDTKYLAPKNDIYVVELTGETEATKEIRESYGFKMSTEKTKAYAYENKFADTFGNACFIAHEPIGTRTPLINLSYEGDIYGIYMYEALGFLYIGHKQVEGRKILSLTTDDHRPNYLLISNWRGHPVTTLIKEMYDKGCLRFSDMKCKMVIDFYLKYDL